MRKKALLFNHNKFRFRKELLLYIFLIPGLMFFLVYRYLPMYGVIMAFQDFRLARGFFGSRWIGLENFSAFFNSAFFPMIMGNTVIISFLKLLIGFPAPIILALMLNECRNQVFKRVIQTVVYLPHFISWVVVGNLVSIFFGINTGLIPQLFNQWFGWNITWLMEHWPFRFILVFSDIWKGIGWGSIIYLAALAGIDPSLYEAAYVDGAKKIQQIVYITLPTLIPLIITMLILRIGGILDAGFEQILILQNSMVYSSSEIIDTYSYSRGFVNGQFGFGTAVGLFKSAIGLVMVLGANFLARRYGEGNLI